MQSDFAIEYNIMKSVAVIWTATLLLLIVHIMEVIALGKVMKMLIKERKKAFFD